MWKYFYVGLPPVTHIFVTCISRDSEVAVVSMLRT